MLKKLKDNLIYYYLILVIIVLVLLPKSVGTIFGFVHIRLLLILGLFVIYIYDFIKKNNKLKTFNKKLFVFCIISIFLLCLGVFKSINKLLFFYTLIKLSSFLGIIFVLSSYNFEKKQKDTLLKVLIAVTLVVSILGIIQYIFEIDIIKNGINKYPGAKGRIRATFHNTIYFGIFLLSSINLLLYKLGKKINIKNKLVIITILLINTISLYFTYTRTVALLLICIVCGYLVFAFLTKNKAKIITYLITFVTILFLIFNIPGIKYLYTSTFFNIMPSKYLRVIVECIESFSNDQVDLTIYNEASKKPTPDEQTTEDNKINENIESNIKDDVIIEEKEEEIEVSDFSVDTRKEFGKMAIKVIKNNPLTGIGLGNYENYVKSNANIYINNRFGYPHNSFLHLTAEIGVIGGIIFSGIILLLVFILLIKSFIEKNESIISLFLISISLFILAFFESFIYDTQLCPLLIIILFLLIEEYKLSPKKSEIMFISSVGGHLTQLLSLKKVFSEYNYILITEKNDVTKGMKEKYNISFLPYCSRNQKISYPFILLWSCIKSLIYFIKYNPRVIVSTGANTAAAMCCLGKLFGRKVIFIESYAKRTSPTITGKCIYKLHAYTTFVVQWESMLEHYPNAVYWGGIY